MTIIDAINEIDALKPNTISYSDKVRWLSQLDGRIKAEIIDTHKSEEPAAFKAYNDTTPESTELLVSSPYDIIYIHYLDAQIDYTNGETKRYNNSSSLYNNAYRDYQNYYNRTHLPKSLKQKFF